MKYFNLKLAIDSLAGRRLGLGGCTSSFDDLSTLAVTCAALPPDVTARVLKS
jgi:hypothetical protein